MPSFLKVEISRKCPIDCRYCAGKWDDRFHQLTRADDVFYSLARYKELIDRLKDYLFLVSLYDIGEPLQNPDALEYIRYAHDSHIGTVVSTSLSMDRPDAFWKGLVTSGLDRLIVAIDGVSPEVYNQYRTNGDLALVMSNLRQVLLHRAQTGGSLLVEWQMLDLPWNKPEQQCARSIAIDMGCDEFSLIPEAMVPRSKYRSENCIRSRKCLLPFIVFQVNAFNQVRPCYKIYDVPMAVGDLSKESFEDIWNGTEMARVRLKRQIRQRPGCMTCQE